MPDSLTELIEHLCAGQLDDLDAGRREATDPQAIANAAGVSVARVSDVLAAVVNARLKPTRRRPAMTRPTVRDFRPVHQEALVSTTTTEEWEAAAEHPSPRIRSAHRNVVALLAELNHSKSELVRMLAADRELAPVRARIAALTAELEQLTARLPDDEQPANAPCPQCGKSFRALGPHIKHAHPSKETS